MKFITGFTPEYKEMVDECAQKLSEVGIYLQKIRFESEGDWIINNHRKVQIMADEIKEEEPICWIDGDIRPNPDFPKESFQKEIETLKSMERTADMICEFRPGQPPFQRYITGFMVWFPSGNDLLQKWREKSDKIINRWREDDVHPSDGDMVHGQDQETLTATIQENSPDVDLILLPDGYNDRDCKESSMWWHLPASREMRDIIDSQDKNNE